MTGLGIEGVSREEVARYYVRANAWVHEARERPEAMGAFVMREENTQQRVFRFPPHQQIGIAHMYDHPRSVQIWPINHAKSFTALTLILFLIAKYPNGRGAIFSRTQAQSRKLLTQVKDYITQSKEYRFLFPHVQPGAKWASSEIYVRRPMGIKDPTAVALGLDSKNILGSRFDWILCDDLLNQENTHTKEARNKVWETVNSTILSRLEGHDWARSIFTNSAWDQDDALHRLEKQGWATLRMQVDGSIYVRDDVMRKTTWDHPLLIPHPDANNEDVSLGERLTYRGWKPGMMLWDPHPSIRSIAWLKMQQPVTPEYNRLYMSMCRDDGSAFCKSEWIEDSKKAAQKAGYTSFTHAKRTGGRIFTGVDLAVSPRDGSDDTCFFTFETLDDGRRVVLDIEVGKFDGPTIVDKISAIHDRYNGLIAVENNACLTPEMPVLTRERGYIPIREVLVGQHVWTHEARWRPVLEVLVGESDTITDFKVRGGMTLEMTPNHTVFCREAKRVPGDGHLRPTGEGVWTSAMMFDRPAYAAVAVPLWPDVPAPRIQLEANKKRAARDLVVDEELALLLGLYMAEGNASPNPGTVAWTLHRKEEGIAAFIGGVLERRFGTHAQHRLHRVDQSRRVSGADKRLATWLAAAFGKGEQKCAPFEWMGWPLALRLAMVRGWFVGDGCLMTNNPGEAPRKFLSGCTISRNWLMFVRSTLMQAGLRPSVVATSPKETIIGGRHVISKGGFAVRLNAEDTLAFLKGAVTPMERERWGDVPMNDRRSNSSMVLEDGHGWSKVMTKKGAFRSAPGPVYNLVVEEDESYTAQDIVVHNAQDFIIQFLRKQNRYVPVKPHHTGSNKADPSHGIVTIFTEIAQGLWLLPTPPNRTAHPAMQRAIDECLYYVPSHHTGDVLMAWWIARELARKYGMLKPLGAETGGVNLDFNTR